MVSWCTAARSVGVTKLQGIDAAKERCPNLVLINGEDLSPYRRASKQILAALQRFGVAERLGMDEVLHNSTINKAFHRVYVADTAVKHCMNEPSEYHLHIQLALNHCHAPLRMVKSSLCTFIMQVFLDVTAEVRSRMERGLFSSSYAGHIVCSKVRTSLQWQHCCKHSQWDVKDIHA